MKKASLLALTTTLIVAVVGSSASAATSSSLSSSTIASNLNKKITSFQTSSSKSVKSPAVPTVETVQASDIKRLGLKETKDATPVIIQKFATVWRDKQGQKQTVELFLYGMKPNGQNLPFYRNIGLAAIEGGTGKVTHQENIINQGMEPKMEWVPQDKFDAAYLLVSATSGGSGGVGDYAIVRYSDGAWKNLLKDFSTGWQADTVFQKNFVAEVLLNNELHFEYPLSTTEKQNLIDQKFYDKNGKVLKQNLDYMLIDSFSEIKLSEEDNMPVFVATQSLAAGNEADRVGNIQTSIVLSNSGNDLDIVKVVYVDAADTEHAVPFVYFSDNK